MKVSSILSTLFAFIQLAFALTYEEALEQIGKDGLLHINDKNFQKIVKNENYAFVVFLTADDPRVGCTLCHEFGPQYKAVAYKYMNSLRSDDKELHNPINDSNDKARFIFAHADFSNSRKYFETLGLQAVPRLFYYEPGKGPQLSSYTDEYSFLTNENLDGFQTWISQNVPGLKISNLKVDPPAQKPMFFISLVFIFLIAIVAYNFRSYISSIAQNKYVWIVLSFILIILFISGHMYNEIRHTSSYRRDKDGNILYFSPGHSSQFGAETQILSIVYGALTISLGLLLSYFPTLKDSKMRAFAVLLACTVVSVLYAYIIEAYHIKSPSYPLYLFDTFISN